MTTESTTNPATTESVHAALLDALGELGIDADGVTPDTRLRADLELDSTEMVQISLELSRAFGVKVKLEEAGDPTAAEICALVLGLVESDRTGA